MTLDEFIAKAKDSLDAFATNWRAQRVDDPANWPNEMNDSCWIEQWIAQDWHDHIIEF